MPRHFGVALELAGAAAVDLVENDVGRTAIQVGVTDNDAAQLSVLGAVGGIVEDYPLLADVVVLELVMRQAIAVGRGNVDDRHAIARLAQGGARGTDHNTLGLGPQRLPEHDVGQQERQAPPGHAPEMIAGFQPGGGLAGQEGKLANVHVGCLGKAKIKGRNPGGSRSALRARSRRPGVPGSGRRSRWRPCAGHG
ncbi:hypothetical protein D3C77_167000 [compost metagenome]